MSASSVAVVVCINSPLNKEMHHTMNAITTIVGTRSDTVLLACPHYRRAAEAAEHHLRAAGAWGDWQRNAFVVGRCPRCAQERAA